MAEVELASGVASLPRDEWNALVADESPFLEWDWLASLEDAGTLTDESGWLPHPLIDATGLSGTWPETKPFMALASETIAEITVPEASAVIQGGVALAMLGLLAHLRVRKRGFADAA